MKTLSLRNESLLVAVDYGYDDDDDVPFIISTSVASVQIGVTDRDSPGVVVRTLLLGVSANGREHVSAYPSHALFFDQFDSDP